MYGGIVWDIIGGTQDNVERKNVFTDITVLTIAVSEALIRWKLEEDVPFKTVLLEEMHRYGCTQSYNSHGSKSAVYVSPVGLAANSLSEALMLAKEFAEALHNDSIMETIATAVAVYLARTSHSKDDIRKAMSGFIGLDHTLDISSQSIVCKAITSFLKSDSFTDAIRIAVSFGGNIDSLAAICGSIAFPYYTAQNGGVVPDDAYRMALAARRRLPHDFRDTIKLFQEIYDPYKYIREKVERECVIMEAEKDLRVGLSGQMADYFMDEMK